MRSMARIGSCAAALASALLCALACDRGAHTASPAAMRAKPILPDSQETRMSTEQKPGTPVFDQPDSLRRRAETALAKAGLNFAVLSPLLPMAWPPDSADARAPAVPPAVEFLVYASRPLPTGVAAYLVQGPVAKVSLPLSAEEPVVTKIADGTVSARGQEDVSGSGTDGMAQAEQALLDVLLRRRQAGAARPDFAAYGRWASRGGIASQDVLKRKKDFFAWIDVGHPAP